ncbi:MAG: hypothetical protein OXI03_07365, partial [Chloroflexota bacterium]|nr:hypothetical protein [Chloroflexota bacterium]
MIDFVGLRRWFALLSLCLVVPCLAALALWQLNPGIDFDGGLELEVRFLRGAAERDVASAVAQAGFSDAEVSTGDEGTFLVAFGLESAGDVAGRDQALVDALAEQIGPVEVVDARLTGADEGVEVELWFPADVSQDDVRDVMRGIGPADA